jgi:hypothetical protein
MLQVGRSPFQIPMRALDFLRLPHPFSRITALGLTQPLTATGQKSSGDKAPSVREADNLTANCEPTV